MAFKLYLYQGLWQPSFNNYKLLICCEWLSNCIFIRVFDNCSHHWATNRAVVNGFQIVSLSGSLTTSAKHDILTLMLWMAFKLYLYQGLWQPEDKTKGQYICCEWLSNCIFIRVFDNKALSGSSDSDVVNGFQIVSLSGSLTTAFSRWQLEI